MRVRIVNQHTDGQKTIFDLENGDTITLDWSGDQYPECYDIEEIETLEGYELTGWVIKK